MKSRASVLVLLVITGWASSVSAAPINAADIVTVDGTDWAQANLFTNLSWNNINDVCPAGVCIDGGTLNGKTMTNWIWASVDDVNGLFNTYLDVNGVSGTDLMGPGPDTYSETGSGWAPAFNVDFLLTDPGTITLTTWGWTATPTTSSIYGHIGLIQRLSSGLDIAQTNYAAGMMDRSVGLGGWFYKKSAQAEVPAPATLALFAIGLASLGIGRRKL